MTITSITPDRRLPGYVVIDADGSRFASLPAEVVQELGLRVGLELDQALEARLRDRAAAEAAYRVATRLMAARARSTFELTRKLREDGHPQAAIDEAVERLRSARVLDDPAFAEHFARGRLSRGHGPSRVLSDLLVRGVERRTAEKAIAAVVLQERLDPQAQVARLIERRKAMVQHLPPQVQRRRLLAFLARRGFRGSEAREAVERAISSR